MTDLNDEDVEIKRKSDSMMIDLGGPLGEQEITEDILRKSLDYNACIDFRIRNPEQLLMDNGKNIRLFDSMMMDDSINSAINIKKRMVLSVPGEFRPASDDPQDISICEFVKDVFDKLKLRWIDCLDNAMDALVYGFKVAEKVWAVEGGKVILKNLKFRHSLLFDFEYDEFANLSVLHVAYYWGGQHIPVRGDDIYKKFLIFVYPYIKDGIYYGQSELREVFHLWLAKQNILKWRNMYVQNYGMPIANVKYDADTVKAGEVEAVTDMLAHLQEQQYFTNPALRDSEGKLQPKFEIDFIDVTKGGSATTNIHEKAIDQLDKMIKRKLLIPDELGFSETNSGSLAKAETQFNLMLSVILYYHGRLEEMVNKELVPQLVNYNFPGVKKYPEWKFQKIDNKLRGDLLQILIVNGVVSPDEPWIREYVNIPEAPEDVSQKMQRELDKIQVDNQSIAQMPSNAPGRVPSTTTAQGYDFPEMNTPHPVSPIAGRPDNIGPNSQSINYPVNVGAYGGSEGLPRGRVIEAIPGGMAKTDNGHGPAPTPMWRTFKRKDISDIYNFDSHRKDLDKNEADFIREYTSVCQDMGEALVRQIQKKKIIEDKDLKSFSTISLPKGDMKSLLSQYFAKMYLLGKANAIDQNKGRLKKARPQAFTKKYFTIDQTDEGIDWLDREWIDNYLKEYGELGTLTKADKEYLKMLRDKAFLITGEEEARMLKVFQIIDSGIKDGLMARDIISAIEAQLSDNRKQYALTIARTNGNEAYNTGCMNLYMSDDVRPGIEAFMFSAIMDDRTTDICAEQDGKIIMKDDPELARYTPPLHFSCRSTLIPVFVGEESDPNSYFYGYGDKDNPNYFDEINHGVRPASGFGG